MSYRIALPDADPSGCEFAVPRDGTILDAARAGRWERPIKVSFCHLSDLVTFLDAWESGESDPYGGSEGDVSDIWAFYRNGRTFGPDHPTRAEMVQAMAKESQRVGDDA